MNDMKLYCIQSGSVKTDKSFATAGRGMGEEIVVPVSLYLITHPQGNVLFDTGMDINVIEKPEETWGPVSAIFSPIMKKGEDVVSQLDKLGYKPSDINYVVNSHLHLDHAGGNRHFPDAEFLVQKDELRVAFWPEIYQRATYARTDFDYPLNYKALEGDYDIFGDGKLVITRTIGHTQGHQSLIVNLKNSGKFLLTGDSVYTKENLDQFVLPGIVWSPDETIKTVIRFQELRDKEGVFILLGHDPESWKLIKKAPEFYD